MVLQCCTSLLRGREEPRLSDTGAKCSGQPPSCKPIAPHGPPSTHCSTREIQTQIALQLPPRTRCAPVPPAALPARRSAGCCCHLAMGAGSRLGARRFHRVLCPCRGRASRAAQPAFRNPSFISLCNSPALQVAPAASAEGLRGATLLPAPWGCAGCSAWGYGQWHSVCTGNLQQRIMKSWKNNHGRYADWAWKGPAPN